MNTVELVIGPQSSLLFRGIPFNFEFEIFVERNVRHTRNSRITAGNHIPYFEALKKMQGLFKSTENHILACLLHLQLHAPLFRFQKHLNWPGFSHFFSRDFFLETTCAPSGSVCARHVAWNLHYAHAHWSLEGAHACHVAWSLKFGTPAGTFRLKREKIKQRKYWKENQFSGL